MSVCRRSIYWGLCWLMGGLFVFAGASKLVNPIAAAEDVRNYDLLGDPWVAITAMLLPWVEIVAGTLLLVAWWVRGALTVIAGCSLVFLVGIGSAWARGLDISCGCFGSASGEGHGPVDYAIHCVLLSGVLIICGYLWKSTAAMEQRC